MRRPGTLPAAAVAATGVGAGNHASSGSSQPRTGATGLFCSSPQTPGGGAGELTNGSASLRTHHSSHSLRRSHQTQSPGMAPALPARGDSCTAERHHQTTSSRVANGMIPGHPPPPPRHSPPCPQSGYPTLPINGHVPHHYRHYRGDRDRSRDRSLSRDREILPHREKMRELELEVHEDDASSGIGTYRA